MKKPDYDKKLVQLLKKEAITRLNRYSIEDTFTIKIKKLDDPNWVAQYRALSQFQNGGRGPIFWFTRDLVSDPEEFIISILHEYGHVIAEWAWANKSKSLAKLLSKNYPGNFGSRPWDEEEFAEDFAQCLSGNIWSNDRAIAKIAKAYIKEYKNPVQFSLFSLASV
jgi:hypothetical protein